MMVWALHMRVMNALQEFSISVLVLITKLVHMHKKQSASANAEKFWGDLGMNV